MMSGSGYVTGRVKSRGGFEITLGGSTFCAVCARLSFGVNTATPAAPIVLRALRREIMSLIFEFFLYGQDIVQAFEEHIDDARVEVLAFAVAQQL